MARPSKYDPEYHPAKGKEFALLGLTDKEMADSFNVAPSTLYLWKNEFSEFSEALSEGKAFADAQVAAVAFQRATGQKMSLKSTKRALRKPKGPPNLTAVTPDNADELGNQEERLVVVEETIVERYIEPSDAMIKFWLVNRQPEKWKHTPDNNVDEPPLPSKVSIQEIDGSLPQAEEE